MFSGSGGADEPYRLPEHLREAVDRQYRKDVERVHGEEAGRFDDEYKSFIQVRVDGYYSAIMPFMGCVGCSADCCAPSAPCAFLLM